jgi:glutamine synthetase
MRRPAGRQGYGDYVMKPDLSTLRRVPWLEGTAMVLCDLIDHHTHKPVPHSAAPDPEGADCPAKELGLRADDGDRARVLPVRAELSTIRPSGYRDLTPISGYNEDYHILQTTKEEHVMRPVRNHALRGRRAGRKLQGRGRDRPGRAQHPLCRSAACADHHTIAKQAVKEIAWANGHSVTFLPKWNAGQGRFAAHVHQSLWSGKAPAFRDENGELPCPQLMRLMWRA